MHKSENVLTTKMQLKFDNFKYILEHTKTIIINVIRKNKLSKVISINFNVRVLS